MNRLPSAKRNAYIAIIFILLLFFLSAGLLVFQFLQTRRSSLQTAEIWQNGQLLMTIPLNEVQESYTFSIPSASGPGNLIQVSPGDIRMLDADCPDRLCVHQGSAVRSLVPVTCLPNQLIIRIRTSSGKEPASMDAVTY